MPLPLGEVAAKQTERATQRPRHDAERAGGLFVQSGGMRKLSALGVGYLVDKFAVVCLHQQQGGLLSPAVGEVEHLAAAALCQQVADGKVSGRGLCRTAEHPGRLCMAGFTRGAAPV